MAALAGIGSLPDTIEDRAVIIELRAVAAERVAKYRAAATAGAGRGRRAAADVGPCALDELGDAEPDMPVRTGRPTPGRR